MTAGADESDGEMLGVGEVVSGESDELVALAEGNAADGTIEATADVVIDTMPDAGCAGVMRGDRMEAEMGPTMETGVDQGDSHDIPPERGRSRGVEMKGEESSRPQIKITNRGAKSKR